MVHASPGFGTCCLAYPKRLTQATGGFLWWRDGDAEMAANSTPSLLSCLPLPHPLLSCRMICPMMLLALLSSCLPSLLSFSPLRQ